MELPSLRVEQRLVGRALHERVAEAVGTGRARLRLVDEPARLQGCERAVEPLGVRLHGVDGPAGDRA